MLHRSITLVVATAVIVTVACNSDSSSAPAAKSTLVQFKATMNGSSEVPSNSSTGTGAFTATLDTVTNVFTYDIVFSGLTTGVTNGHIHGPAANTATAGTTLNFNTWPGAQFSFGLQAGTARGVATLTAATQITATMNGDSLKKLLNAGLTYANIHTTSSPGGEIRGQIVRFP